MSCCNSVVTVQILHRVKDNFINIQCGDCSWTAAPHVQYLLTLPSTEKASRTVPCTGLGTRAPGMWETNEGDIEE